MKKSNFFKFLMAAFSLGIMVTSCDDDDDPKKSVDQNVKEKYVVVTQAAQNGPSYLLTAESLSEGAITTKGNGTESKLVAEEWLFHGDDYVFGIQYNRDKPAESASYILDSNTGRVEEHLSYKIYRYNSYGVYGDHLIVSSTNAGNNNSKSTIDPDTKEKRFGHEFQLTWLDTKKAVAKPENFDAENYLDNGEIVNFAGFVDKNGWLYSSVVPSGMSHYGVIEFKDDIKDPKYVTKGTGGGGSETFTPGQIVSTQYPDNAYVAIFKNKSDFPTKPIIVETDKMGFACGRYRGSYYQTIWAADNGDVYVFSPGIGRNNTETTQSVNGTPVPLPRVTGKLKAKVMRIKAGQTDFDKTYDAVDLETLLGNRTFVKTYHITKDYFLIQAFNDANEVNIHRRDKKVYTNRLYIYKGESKTIKEVTGLPDLNTISLIGIPFGENGLAHVPITTKDEGGKPTIYEINPETGKAKAGLKVDALRIHAIGKLNAK